MTAACEYAAGKAATIYTDSRYAFGVVHDFGMAWAARGFLTSSGSPVKNAVYIDGLLTAMLRPDKLAVVKVAGHYQKPGLSHAMVTIMQTEPGKHVTSVHFCRGTPQLTHITSFVPY